MANTASVVLKLALGTGVLLILAIPSCRSQSINPDDYVRAVALNTAGTVRAEVNLDGSLTVTETSAKAQTHLDDLKPTRAYALALSPNGEFVAAGDTEGNIQVWDVSKRNLVRTILQIAGVWSLAFDSSGKQLAAGGHKEVSVWDVRSGHELHKWPIRDTSTSLSFDPKGKWLAAGDFNVLHLWNLNSNQSLEAKSSDFEIISIAFSPDKVSRNGWLFRERETENPRYSCP